MKQPYSGHPFALLDALRNPLNITRYRARSGGKKNVAARVRDFLMDTACAEDETDPARTQLQPSDLQHTRPWLSCGRGAARALEFMSPMLSWLTLLQHRAHPFTANTRCSLHQAATQERRPPNVRSPAVTCDIDWRTRVPSRRSLSSPRFLTQHSHTTSSTIPLCMLSPPPPSTRPQMPCHLC